jgi:hypothetical protein
MTGSAKQSILSLRGAMDCFAALAMTALHLNRRGCLKIESEARMNEAIFGNERDAASSPRKRGEVTERRSGCLNFDRVKRPSNPRDVIPG